MNAAASRKFFSIDKANQALPLVKVIVQDIVELYKDVAERRERLSRVLQLHGSSTRKRDEANLYSEELEQMETELAKDEERLQDYVAELEAIGVDLKDARIGLADFPALYEGREICLCWKLGEDKVEHWHEVDTGFAGRRPVAGLDLSRPAADAGGDEA